MTTMKEMDSNPITLWGAWRDDQGWASDLLYGDKLLWWTSKERALSHTQAWKGWEIKPLPEDAIVQSPAALQVLTNLTLINFLREQGCVQEAKESLPCCTQDYTLTSTAGTWYNQDLFWHPIRGKYTMPAEKARILVYAPKEPEGYRVGIVTWFPGSETLGDPHHTHVLNELCPYTHWMPLPVAPEE